MCGVGSAPPLRARAERAGPYRAIAKCQFPIANWSVAIGQSAIGIGQLAILRPTRYRVVVLTSWDRELECLPRVEPLTNDEKL